MDEEKTLRSYRSGLARLGLLGAVGTVAGVGAIVLGLNRSGTDRAVTVVLGALILLCVLGVAGAVLRIRLRERRMAPEQVAEDRTARMAEAERRQAASDSSAWPTVLTTALGIFWLVYLVVGLGNDAWRQAAVSAFFLLLVLATWLSRRRRRQRRLSGR